MRLVGPMVLALFGIAGTATARADYYVGGGLLVTGGIGEVNLGELMGEPRDGGNDLTGRRAGIFLRGGYGYGPIEVGPRVGIALGGLSLERVERVYFDSEVQPIGGAAVADVALEVRFEQDLGVSWTPFGGGALGWERMAASSPAGSARLDAVFGEAAAGISWGLGAPGVSAGRLDFAVVIRVSGAYRVHLDGQRNAAEEIGYFGSPGLSVAYTYRL